MAALEEERQEMEESAAAEEAQVVVSAQSHEIYAVAVTMFSLGITLGGMAVVVERKLLWILGLVFCAVGVIGMGLAVLKMLLR